MAQFGRTFPIPRRSTLLTALKVAAPVHYTLTADPGAFAVTGTAANLRAGHVISAASGSFAVTGTAVTLRRGLKTSATAGSFVVTGTAATFKRGLAVSAASGAFTVTGAAATFKRTYATTSQAGSYVVTGTDATLIYGTSGDFTLAANSGSFVVTGTAATLTVAHRFSVASGSFTIAGTAAALRIGRKLTAAVGAYTVTGTATSGLYRGRKLSAASGSFAVSGTSAALRMAHKSAAATGSAVVAGTAATLRQDYRLHADIGVPQTLFMGDGDSGGGYVTATDVPTQDLNPGGGTGLTLDIVAVAGSITSVAIHTPGSGYQFGDPIEIEQPGSGFNGYVTIASVSDVVVVSSANPFSPPAGGGVRALRMNAAEGGYIISGTAAALTPSVINRLGYLPDTSTRVRSLPNTTNGRTLPTSTKKSLV